MATVIATNWLMARCLIGHRRVNTRKVEDYAALGIGEYWIAEHYAGLGGVRHIGKPKQPTLSICTLVDGEYKIQVL